MAELAAAIRHIPMPFRIAKLPVSDKGFPIPAFVAWLDLAGKRNLPPGTFGAKRDFRIIDSSYMDRCYRFNRCWICDEPLGRHRVFAIGPMCVVNRTTMEPPSHRTCAEYAAKACPFLVQPRMRRNYKDLPPEDRKVAGMMIERNPGAIALYETGDYRRFHAHGGGRGMLCQLGDPVKVDWYTEGRIATRAEVSAALDSGLPILAKDAEREGPEAVQDLRKYRERADRFLPA
jgi:hypothetical protein